MSLINEANSQAHLGEEMSSLVNQDHLSFFGQALENPNQQAHQDGGFGYYGYISEDNFPDSGFESWSQLWEVLKNLDSPKSPLLLQESHASLQSGSSSYYHYLQRRAQGGI